MDICRLKHGASLCVLASALVLGACATAQTPLRPVVENDSPVDVAAMLKSAQQQRLNRDFASATRTLSQLVLALPDDPRVLSEYGKVLLDKGETADALAFLQRSLELQGDWSVYSAQGVAYAQTEDYGRAAMAFEQALAMKPGEPTVLNNFALAELQAGKLDHAETLLLEAAKSDSENPRVVQNLALVRRLRAGQEAVTPLAPPPPLGTPLPASPQLPTSATLSAPDAVVSDNRPQSIADLITQTELPAPAATQAITQEPEETLAAAIPSSKPAPSVVARAQVHVIQVGSYTSEETASRAATNLKFFRAVVSRSEQGGKVFHRVRIGPLTERDKPEAILAEVQALGFPGARLMAGANPTPANRTAAAAKVAAPKAPPAVESVPPPPGTPTLRLSRNATTP